MPMHDWTRVPAGIYHAFHHRWISAISDALNAGLLTDDYYALPEQATAGFGPDVLTLRGPDNRNGTTDLAAATTATMTRPRTRFTMQSDEAFYRKKMSLIAVRHVSGDEVVAVVEIVSPGNKSGRGAFRAFVDKALDFLEQRIHLLIVDPFPPGRRDPNGVHAAIWEEVQPDGVFQLPADKRLTIVSYECQDAPRSFIEPIAVGDKLPDMPLYLDPDEYVMVPLESTYFAAFEMQPRRWRDVLA